MEAVMRKTQICGRNDDCGWESVGVVLLVGALVVPVTANQNWTVHSHCLREEHWQDLILKRNEKAWIGI